jgi:hypothetical protein
MTVQEALPDNIGLQDIQGQYSIAVLAEFLDIWDLVQPDVEMCTNGGSKRLANSLVNQLMRLSSMGQFILNQAS